MGLVCAGSAGAAVPSGSGEPCNRAAFTGRVGPHPALCVRPPTTVAARGARGARGVTGDTGAVGRTGTEGRPGSAGAAGAEGRGITGSTGAAGTPGARGEQCVAGGVGVTGLQGMTGETGSTGDTGMTGDTGDTGMTGDTGSAGATGAAGTPGVQGATGAAGSTGATGSQGVAGANGPPGPAGSTGPAGAPCPPGSNGVTQYAYVYNLSAETVPLEADVIFDTNGVMTAGITHEPGTGGITLLNAGVYEVSFSVSGTEPNQMALFLNEALALGTIYASGAGTQQNIGQAIISVAAGDVLTVRNYTSSAAVGLATPIGGTRANTNASVTIELLS